MAQATLDISVHIGNPQTFENEASGVYNKTSEDMSALAAELTSIANGLELAAEDAGDTPRGDALSDKASEAHEAASAAMDAVTAAGELEEAIARLCDNA